MLNNFKPLQLLNRLSIVILVGLVTPQLGYAQTGGNEQLPLQGPKQPDDCVTQAATYHGVSPWILRAIIQVESNFNAKAVNKNTNGTTDVGVAQINSMHFKELSKHGIAPSDLMNACVSSYVAAWHLKKQIVAYGNTWFAVGAYHSTTKCYNDRYTGLVWNVLLKWGVVNGPRARTMAISDCARTKPSAADKKSAGNKETSLLALD